MRAMLCESGCLQPDWQDQQSALSCVGNETLRLAFTSLFLPLVNITFGGKYACLNPRVQDAYNVYCEAPGDIDWQDRNVTLSVEARCGNETSIPFVQGVNLLGPLSVTGVSGCAQDEMNGTAVWRAGGCAARGVITISGQLSSLTLSPRVPVLRVCPCPVPFSHLPSPCAVHLL